MSGRTIRKNRKGRNGHLDRRSKRLTLKGGAPQTNWARKQALKEKKIEKLSRTEKSPSSKSPSSKSPSSKSPSSKSANKLKVFWKEVFYIF